MSPKTTPATPAQKLGSRIRERRLELGLSQLELAERARPRLTVAKVSELENGRSGIRGPTLSRLYQVAGALRCKPAALLDA
jgi:transcriptional regulator with XRE-family HTH domain